MSHRPDGVPLLDLTEQYASLRADIDAAIRGVVESQRFVLGPVVEAFEASMAAYVGVDHAIGVASGTDALLLSLRALRPAPGDEVIVPAFTFFATAGAVVNAGFTPVFCDVDAGTFNVTVDTVDAVWSERTRAVVPVHLFGQMAPAAELAELASRRDAVVIEDAAQAIGARRRGRPAGSVGLAGAFSFFPTKNLGGFGDGGMVTTDAPHLADAVRKLRVHGGRQMYQHEMVGTNSRLDALQAAVLSVKLRHLDGWTRARRKNACLYHGLLAELPDVVLPATEPDSEHVFNQYTLRARRRDELRAFLSDRRIGSGVYYPVPLHLQECFESIGPGKGSLPVSEALVDEVVSLPIFPELDEPRVRLVASTIREFYGA